VPAQQAPVEGELRRVLPGAPEDFIDRSGQDLLVGRKGGLFWFHVEFLL
jgi:hypothetical protein